jgi:hypothetical protein
LGKDAGGLLKKMAKKVKPKKAKVLWGKYRVKKKGVSFFALYT